MKSPLFLGVILILGAASARLLPHPPNVTPVMALALAGGIYLDRRISLIVPVAAMVLSDTVLGFHAMMVWVYSAIALTVFIGTVVAKRKSIGSIVLGSLVGSLAFFLITNAAVWFHGNGTVYPMTLEGLALCYTAAIPFYRNSLLGDLMFTGLLVGLFEGSLFLLWRTKHGSETSR